MPLSLVVNNPKRDSAVTAAQPLRSNISDPGMSASGQTETWTTDVTLSTDAELLRAHIMGDRRAFTVLLDRHHRLMRSAIRHAGVRDSEASSDVLQDALLKLHRHAPQWDGHCKVSTWIYTLSRNTALSFLRSQSRHAAHADGVEFEERLRTLVVPSSREESTVTRLDVHRYLRAMPRELREVLVLTALRGYSEQDAAAALGIPVGTVKSRKSRARQTLRAMVLGTIPVATQRPRSA